MRENVAILAHVLGVGKDVGRADLEPIERVGARRAEAGIPLEDVLHAYRIVSRVCWGVLSEECRAFKGDALEATIDIAEAVLRYTDHINTSVADAYARAQRAIVREQEGARREFLSDLLYGTDASPDDILRRAHAFGYDLSLSYVAMVGTSSQSTGREMEVAAAATRAAELANTDPIVLQKADHTIALIPAGPGVDLATMPEKLVARPRGRMGFRARGPGARAGGHPEGLPGGARGAGDRHRLESRRVCLSLRRSAAVSLPADRTGPRGPVRRSDARARSSPTTSDARVS